jgi:glc operon protein GlcG
VTHRFDQNERRKEKPMHHYTSLGHDEAQQAIQAIRTELLKRRKAAVIAVADVQGELIGLLRLDGAPLASIMIAANKAWTAARERKPTRELGQAARDPEHGFDMAYFGDPRYIGWGGGLPVIIDGLVVGAVAVSGLTEHEDTEMAEIGISSIIQ